MNANAKTFYLHDPIEMNTLTFLQNKPFKSSKSYYNFIG